MAVKTHKSATATTAIAAMLVFNACPAQAFQPLGFLAFPTQHSVVQRGHVRRFAPAPVTRLTTAMRRPSMYSNDDDMNQSGSFSRWPQQVGAAGFHGGGPAVVAPPGFGFQDSMSTSEQVGEPAVTSDTAQEYTLTFALPSDVDDDGLEVTVTGGLLTVKVKSTREDDPGNDRNRGGVDGGWILQSTWTDTLSRSFVLPEGVSTSDVRATWKEDNTVQVKFNKAVDGDGGGNAAGNKNAPPIASNEAVPAAPTVESLPSVTTTLPVAASAGVGSSRGAATNKATRKPAAESGHGGVKFDGASNAKAAAAAVTTTVPTATELNDYLAELSEFITANNKAASDTAGRTPKTPAPAAPAAASPAKPVKQSRSGITRTANSNSPVGSPVAAASPSSAASADANPNPRPAARGGGGNNSRAATREPTSGFRGGRSRGGRSVAEALNHELGEFARLMLGDENAAMALRVPTEEQMRARVEAARDERARRAMALRRATMVAEVGEKDGAYVVRYVL